MDTSSSRVKRKPVPSSVNVVRIRYPDPDPSDPFAPLWVLRSRSSSPAVMPLPTSHQRRQDQQKIPLKSAGIVFPPSDRPSSSSEDPAACNVQRSALSSWAVSSPSASVSTLSVHPTTTNPSSLASSSFVHVSECLGSVRKGISTSVSMPFPSTNSGHYNCARRTSVLMSSKLSSSPEWALPTASQLKDASSISVITASGLRIPFSTLFSDRKAVIVFVRHFWCAMCQEYVSHIAEALRAAPAPHTFFLTSNSNIDEKGNDEKNRVHLVIIGNGSPAFIPKYKALFALTCEVYVDPSLALYSTLGMGCTASPSTSLAPGVCGDNHPETVKTIQDGGYVRHGPIKALTMVVLRALKSGMPIWERGGDVAQLGGEFVLGPGMTCTYAHRMQSPKGHAPIRDILSTVGVHLPSLPITISHRNGLQATPTAFSPPPSTLSSFPTLPSLHSLRTLNPGKGRATKRSLLRRNTTFTVSTSMKAGNVTSAENTPVSTGRNTAVESDVRNTRTTPPMRFGRASLDLSSIHISRPFDLQAARNSRSPIRRRSLDLSSSGIRRRNSPIPQARIHTLYYPGRSEDLVGLGFEFGAKGTIRTREEERQKVKMPSLVGKKCAELVARSEFMTDPVAENKTNIYDAKEGDVDTEALVKNGGSLSE